MQSNEILSPVPRFPSGPTCKTTAFWTLGLWVSSSLGETSKPVSATKTPPSAATAITFLQGPFPCMLRKSRRAELREASLLQRLVAHRWICRSTPAEATAES